MLPLWTAEVSIVMVGLAIGERLAKAGLRMYSYGSWGRQLTLFAFVHLDSALEKGTSGLGLPC